MRLGLDLPRQEQVERVAGDVEQELLAKRNPGLFVAEIQLAGFRRGGTR
jgi:hypothetical protein